MTSNILQTQYPSIGLVTYKRNSKAIRLSIRIKRTGEVIVTIPRLLSFNIAEEFVLSKSEWIVEKLTEIESKKSTVISDGFNTRNHTIKLQPSNTNIIKVRYLKPKIVVLYPETLDYREDKVQLATQKAIEIAYRTEAHEYLPSRVKEIAAEHGFSFNKLTIRKSVTRWGSCSSKNNISLSLYLMKLPNKLIDYVILHELCHTIHKNHGIQFWRLLDRHTNGEAKTLAKEVRKFGTAQN